MAIDLKTLLRMHDFHLETNTLGRVLCGTVSHKKYSEPENTLKVSDVNRLDFTRWILSLVGKKSIAGESQENSHSQEEGFTDKEISLVTDDELEVFAREFIAHNGWLLHSCKRGERSVRIDNEGKEVVSYLPESMDLPQEAGESSTNYLVRVFRHFFEEQGKRPKLMIETASGKTLQKLAHDHFAETNRYLVENSVTASLDRGMKPSYDLMREIEPFKDMKSCLQMYSANESIAERLKLDQDMMEVATRHLKDAKWQYEGITQSAILATSIYHGEDKIRETVRGLTAQRATIPESIASWLEKQQQDDCDLLKRHEAMFRIPQPSETARLLSNFHIGSVAEWASQKYKDIIDWHRTIDAISTPWLNKEESARSISAVLELQSIGNALSIRKGFDLEFTAALRLDLGDWRDKIIFPEAVFLDPAVRTDFYISRGFNPALTDFPEAAFHQCLDLAGLEEESEDIELYGAATPFSTYTEEAGLQQNDKCYKLLLRFERQMRQFINGQMTVQFGPDWPRHRLPPETYQQWVEKKKKAGGNGEHLLLIEFADFNDYPTIICRGDQWKQVFGTKFNSKESVRESFQRLHPIRVAVMHSRIVTKDDILFLFAETLRLIRAIDQS